MTIQVERLDELVTALRTVLRDEQILTSKPDRYNRARVPAPFPVHRWSERLPDLAVLPTSTAEVAGVVRIANELRVPVVPRDGGTGLTDGAVPLRGGIVVDVKRMNKIKELDLENRTVTVGTGINMLKLNEQLAQHGLFYPDDPASYPCSLVGGRIGTSGWSLIGSRYGHTRDLVLSFDHVLPTGEVMHVGDGIGHKVSKSSSGYQLKHLFMGHQGTLGIATEATLKLFPKPEAELSPFWAFDNYHDAYACVGALAQAGVATFGGAVLFDEWKVAYLRRDDEAYIPQPGDVRALVCAVMYGYEDEVRPAGKRLFRIAKEYGARYLALGVRGAVGAKTFGFDPRRGRTPRYAARAHLALPRARHQRRSASVNRPVVRLDRFAIPRLVEQQVGQLELQLGVPWYRHASQACRPRRSRRQSAHDGTSWASPGLPLGSSTSGGWQCAPQ